MDTEEVSAEAPAEPTTVEKDATAEENEESEMQDKGEEEAPTKQAEAVTEVEGEGEAVTEMECETVTQVEGEAVAEKEDEATLEKESEAVEEKKDEAVAEKEGESKAADEPSCDWLEPLEEDCEDGDTQSFDGEAESIAGSELSGSGVMKSAGGRGVGRPRRRTQVEADEGWEDCPVLGKGWKRKEVFRRSGTSEGRSDTYYKSPRGRKVRSRVELTKYIGHAIDLTNFDFKKGQFLGEGSRKRKPRIVSL